MTHTMRVRVRWGQHRKTHVLYDLTDAQVLAYQTEYARVTPNGGTTQIDVTPTHPEPER